MSAENPFSCLFFCDLTLLHCFDLPSRGGGD
jgi:hypothetical protein